MSKRFMTRSDKERELNLFAKNRELADVEILPYCDALNTLPGVCTLQSCAGHRSGEVSASAPEGTRDQYSVRPACLWLWLDEKTARRFYECAAELGGHPLMEHVAVRFQPYGQQVVEIFFAGNDRGPGYLDSSMRVIFDFLGKVAI